MRRFLFLPVIGAIIIFVLIGCKENELPASNTERLPVPTEISRPQLSMEDLKKEINKQSGEDFASLISTKSHFIPYDHFLFNRIYHVDMNGDGIEDRTTVIRIGEGTESITSIKVNDSTIAISQEEHYIEGFQILDVNEEDQYKEIALYKNKIGDSEEQIIDLYYFDKNNVKFLGSLTRISEEEIYTHHEVKELLLNRAEQ